MPSTPKVTREQTREWGWASPDGTPERLCVHRPCCCDARAEALRPGAHDVCTTPAQVQAGPTGGAGAAPLDDDSAHSPVQSTPLNAARVLSRASPYLTPAMKQQQGVEKGAGPLVIRHAKMELDVFWHIIGALARKLVNKPCLSGSWGERRRKILLWLQTSYSTFLPRGGRNGFKLQPGEGKYRMAEPFRDLMLLLEDWLSSYVFTPSQLLLHRDNHYLNAVRRAAAAEVPSNAWKALVAQFDAAHPAQAPTPADVTSKIWLDLVKVHVAQRMRTELRTAGLFHSAEVGSTLRNSIRQKRGQSRKGSGASTYYRDKAQAMEAAVGKRGHHQFHFTVTAPSAKPDFQHGIPFVFADDADDKATTVTVGAVGARLIVSSYSGGLDDLPEEQRMLASGDRLLQIAGENVATWTRAQIQNRLIGAVYPLTYTFVRDLRSAKYKEFVQKKTAARASKSSALTNYKTAAAKPKPTNKRLPDATAAHTAQQAAPMKRLNFGTTTS